VADVERLTRDSVAITFTVASDLGDTFAFSAGQHVTIRGLHSGGPIRRSYSVCEPEGSRRLRIAVKHQPDGAFSTYALRDLRPGDVLQVAPPTGRFLAEPLAPGRRCAAVAAGSGITPVLSIVATTLQADPDITWILHYANRTRDAIMFRREIDALATTHAGRLSVVHHLSRETDPGLGELGRVDPSRITAQDADEWFCCGPAGLVMDLAETLEGQGLPASRLHVELFTARAAGRRTDPTAPLSEVVLSGAGRDVVVRVRPGEPILSAALAIREDLPYSCLGGSCGSCLAELTHGEVTIDEVPFMALTDEDRVAGRVLACLASPSTPEVRLRFTSGRPREPQAPRARMI
jgi:ferredoxin-NADP reductase